MTVPGLLDDLATLLGDVRTGTVDDFEIDEDPDEDLEVTTPTVVDVSFSITDLSPITLLYILQHRFGSTWWENDRDAIFSLLNEVGLSTDESDKDMVRALQLLYVDEAYWTEWEVFNWITQGLTDGVTEFSSLPVLGLKDMSRSMLVAVMTAKDQKVEVHYSDEVLSYIAVTCIEHGQWALPYPLNVAQSRVDQLMAWRGIKDLPLARVKAIARESVTPKTTSEITVQAFRYRTLTDFIIQELKESRAEIDAYRDATED